MVGSGNLGVMEYLSLSAPVHLWSIPGSSKEYPTHISGSSNFRESELGLNLKKYFGTDDTDIFDHKDERKKRTGSEGAPLNGLQRDSQCYPRAESHLEYSLPSYIALKF